MAHWTLHLARQAEQDIASILAWTDEHFGPQQAEIYAETFTLALEALIEGPDIVGVRRRNDILPGIYLLHVARYGRRGRHFIVFRPSAGRYIEVLRVPHDSMDPARHLGP